MDISLPGNNEAEQSYMTHSTSGGGKHYSWIQSQFCLPQTAFCRAEEVSQSGDWTSFIQKEVISHSHDVFDGPKYPLLDFHLKGLSPLETKREGK